jgi:hypothetical protein
MYGDSSYGSSNGAIPDTRSATEEKGDQKLGRRVPHLFYFQLLAIALLVTAFAVVEVLVISPLK